MLINAGWLLFQKDGPIKQQETRQLTYTGPSVPLCSLSLHNDLTRHRNPKEEELGLPAVRKRKHREVTWLTQGHTASCGSARLDQGLTCSLPGS